MTRFITELGLLANLAEIGNTHILRSGGANFYFEHGMQLLHVERLGRWATGSISLRRHYIAFQALQAVMSLAAMSRSLKQKCRLICGERCLRACD